MYDIPSEEVPKTEVIADFKGVDFSSSPFQVAKYRSPNAKNVINNDGFNETRPGYKVLSNLGLPINGVWNIDTDIGDLFLVHAGPNLYQYNSDFSQHTLVLSGMNNTRSRGLYFNENLVIFDGTRPVIFSKFESSYEAKFLDEVGYIPTTSIARDYSGGGTDYEEINLISPYRINSFLTEEITVTTDVPETDESGNNILDDDGNIIYKTETKLQTVYILEETDITSVEYVQQLSSEGTIDIVDSSKYTVDAVKGTVTFLISPGLSPVLGRDNIMIKYKKDNTEEKSKINKCSIAELFGYEGNNNRIFISGNPDFKNYDFHCAQDDCTYWPDGNFTRIGVEPIVNYSRLSDGSMAIQKKHSDTDCTVYYRTSSLLDTVEVFPLDDGVRNIGCLSKYANANLLNDPLTLTSQGVFAIIGNNGEKYAMQRSYYVNSKLMKEPNLDDAIAITVNGKYYLGINDHVYVADSRYLSYPKNAKTSQYQYEWWYWDNIPAHVFFSWNEELYFGTLDGKICKFSNDYLDIDAPVNAYWETPYLSLNSTNYTKTIKLVTLHLNPFKNSDLTLGYELEDGQTEIITTDLESSNFPKVIQEKEKIKNFMFVKFFIKNNKNSLMTFENITLEYDYSGRYKGE